MIELFKSIKSLLVINKICIDNHIFRLHYKATVVLLISCSILVTAKQFFGEPILCISDKIPAKVMQTYCWIQSTFTLANRLNEKPGTSVIHPGVADYVEGKDEVSHHKYYQWVCFMLFFQGICFYIPHYIWKSWESNRVSNLVKNLNNPMLGANKRAHQLKILTNYFLENFHRHNWYARRFFMCEILNFFNVIFQIFLVDRFLDFEFSSYGSRVLSFMGLEQENRTDPMTRIFPKVTKCIFHKFGPTGTIEKHDSLCVLPLNIINEKIYIVLWFWLITVAIVSAMSILYRTMTWLCPDVRLNILRLRTRIVNLQALSYVVEAGDIGDWFVLLQLARNMDALNYKELIEDLERKMRRIWAEEEGRGEVFVIEKVDDFDGKST